MKTKLVFHTVGRVLLLEAALMLLPLLRMTLAVYRNMMTFDGMGIDAYRPL